MGSFKILQIEGNNEFKPAFTQNIENINSLLQIFSTSYSINQKNEIVNTYTGRMEQYPHIRVITISEKQNENILYQISKATHDTKTEVGEESYAPNLGYARSGRFASPIYVSIIDGNRTIVTNLAAIPGRDTRKLSFYVQEQFLNKIL